MAENSTIGEALLKRDRWIAIGGITMLSVLAWWALLAGAGTGMSPSHMTTWQFPLPVRPAMAAAWDPTYWVVMLGMWWVMMIAMMAPSAAPLVLLYARTMRRGQRKGRLHSGPVPSGAFLFGYLLVWFGFSVAATTAQWLLERLGVVHGMTMWSIDSAFSSAVLIFAGLYQLTPLKRVCLDHCRSPAEFLSRHWRPGRRGALRLGIVHGAYCLGCCWVLMALLFVGGVMNLVWIAGLAIIVLIEKIAPYGQWIARITGLILIAAGLGVLALASPN